MVESVSPLSSAPPSTWTVCRTPPLPATSIQAAQVSAASLENIPVSQPPLTSPLSHTKHCFIDRKRELLQEPTNPEGSESPLDFDPFTLNHTAFVGVMEVVWEKDVDKERLKRKLNVKKGSASYNHFAFFKSKPKTREESDSALAQIAASQELAARFSLTPDQAGFGLTEFSLEETLLGSKCPKGGPCDPSLPYR